MPSSFRELYYCIVNERKELAGAVIAGNAEEVANRQQHGRAMQRLLEAANNETPADRIPVITPFLLKVRDAHEHLRIEAALSETAWGSDRGVLAGAMKQHDEVTTELDIIARQFEEASREGRWPDERSADVAGIDEHGWVVTAQLSGSADAAAVEEPLPTIELPPKPLHDAPRPEESPDGESGLPVPIIVGPWRSAGAQTRDTLPTVESAAAPPSRPPAAPALPWEGDDWDNLEPMVRRLLRQMHGRERIDLADLCPLVWEKDFADVSNPSLHSAIHKANCFLGKRQERRVLEKVRGEAELRWR